MHSPWLTHGRIEGVPARSRRRESIWLVRMRHRDAGQGDIPGSTNRSVKGDRGAEAKAIGVATPS